MPACRGTASTYGANTDGIATSPPNRSSRQVAPASVRTADGMTLAAGAKCRRRASARSAAIPSLPPMHPPISAMHISARSAKTPLVAPPGRDTPQLRSLRDGRQAADLGLNAAELIGIGNRVGLLRQRMNRHLHACNSLVERGEHRKKHG